MTGPIHYRAAEKLLDASAQVVRNHDDTCPEADRMIAEAQVHATLALAAATDQNTRITSALLLIDEMERDGRIVDGADQLRSALGGGA